MIHAETFLLSLGGFFLLMLAMSRHQQDWLNRRLHATRSRLLRLSGFMALTLAFVVAGTQLGWGYGTICWFGWLTLAAIVVVIADINRKHIIRKDRK